MAEITTQNYTGPNRRDGLRRQQDQFQYCGFPAGALIIASFSGAIFGFFIGVFFF